MVTHQLEVERRTVKVRQSETDVLPLCHATNPAGHTSEPCKTDEPIEAPFEAPFVASSWPKEVPYIRRGPDSIDTGMGTILLGHMRECLDLPTVDYNIRLRAGKVLVRSLSMTSVMTIAS